MDHALRYRLPLVHHRQSNLLDKAHEAPKYHQPYI
jgi:hypothetical protein